MAPESRVLTLAQSHSLMHRPAWGPTQDTPVMSLMGLFRSRFFVCLVTDALEGCWLVFCRIFRNSGLAAVLWC